MILPTPVPALSVTHPVTFVEPSIVSPYRASQIGRILTLIAVVAPFLGLIAAFILVWGWGFTWVDLGLLVGFYMITAIGITAGFHRHFTHRSFDTYQPIRWALAILGSMTIQGPVLRWVAWHRRHHQMSDDVHDPHSPHYGGAGIRGWIRGFWHAHVGWLFGGDPPDLARYVTDLRKSRLVVWASALFPLWVLLGLAIPFFMGYWLTGSWIGAVRALLWAGLVRIFLVHHVTWSVNSVCHLWGRQTYKSNDQSRDNLVFGVLALGEGWHNTHHAFPTSARHGLRWWQLDMSYIFIRTLQVLGLAWNVKLPSEQAIAAARA